MDETCDITAKQMICLCLRYVEEDTGRIIEELFMIKPITDTSGEGKELYQIISQISLCLISRCFQCRTAIH